MRMMTLTFLFTSYTIALLF